MAPRPAHNTTTLPQRLAEELEVSMDGHQVARRKRAPGGGSGGGGRKERRKAERGLKKRRQSQHHPVGKRKFEAEEWESFSEEEAPGTRVKPRFLQKTPKILTQKQAALPEESPAPRTVTKKLDEEDDQEIKALEKKLGILSKGKKRKSPLAFEDDGLGELMEGLDDFGSEESEDKSEVLGEEEIEWLESKRRKARGEVELQNFSTEGSEDELLGFDTLSEKEDDEPAPKKKERENPYIAPVTADAPSIFSASATARYIPPSLRPKASSETDQLQRQLKGLFNRLTNDNLHSIFSDISNIYRTNPRQAVTGILVDLLMGHTSQESLLRKESLIDHAGLVAVIYRDISVEAGAQIVENIVDTFTARYQRIVGDSVANDESQRQMAGSLVNLMGLLSELGAFGVVGSQLLFDYVQLFVGEVNELNAKLLVRIAEVTGPLLRNSSPTALKDIHKVFSSRALTKNRVTGPTTSAIDMLGRLREGKKRSDGSAAHAINVKRIVGEITAKTGRQSRAVPEPLNVGLKDINDSDVRGRWWIVGAKFNESATAPAESASTLPKEADSFDDHEESFLPHDITDLHSLATAHRMNTSVRRSIFVALLSATDASDAHIRLSSLRLSKTQLPQVPAVLLHCCAKESSFNLYYAIIARRICSERAGKGKVGVERAIWDFIGRLEGNDEEAVELKEIVHVGKSVGRLIAWGALRMDVLRRIKWPAVGLVGTFVEVVLVEGLGNAGNQLSTVFQGVSKWPGLTAQLGQTIKAVRLNNDLVPDAKKSEWKMVCKSALKSLNAPARGNNGF
ncbi:MAG: suppressor of glycerol defect [Vezdaea aestivalis]|nr:MAG: suppressor of glycerol defect [Vezdaea aestivalis]